MEENTVSVSKAKGIPVIHEMVLLCAVEIKGQILDGNRGLEQWLKEKDFLASDHVIGFCRELKLNEEDENIALLQVKSALEIKPNVRFISFRGNDILSYSQKVFGQILELLKGCPLLLSVDFDTDNHFMKRQLSATSPKALAIQEMVLQMGRRQFGRQRYIDYLRIRNEGVYDKSPYAYYRMCQAYFDVLTNYPSLPDLSDKTTAQSAHIFEMIEYYNKVKTFSFVIRLLDLMMTITPENKLEPMKEIRGKYELEIHRKLISLNNTLAQADCDQKRADIYWEAADGCLVTGQFDRAREYLSSAMMLNQEQRLTKYIELTMSECPEVEVQPAHSPRNHTVFFQAPPSQNPDFICRYDQPPPSYVERNGEDAPTAPPMPSAPPLDDEEDDDVTFCNRDNDSGDQCKNQ